METNIVDRFNKELGSEASIQGVFGKDMANMRKSFSPQYTNLTEDDERTTSVDYLKDGVTLNQIYKLAKNKKLSNNKIKQEIRKLLKNSEELDDFLRSFIKKDENKEQMDMGVGNYTGSVGGVVGTRNESDGETKEATSSGGGVGAYDAPLFGSIKKNKIEATEATSSGGGVGAYETPSAFAKTTSKKNWRGKSKTQIPGGKFVQVKKKCKRFPYCNQGDINALKLSENETLERIIKNVSEKYGIHEDHIKNIISHEMRKLKN